MDSRSRHESTSAPRGWKRRLRRWSFDAFVIAAILMAIGWWQTRDLVAAGQPAPSLSMASLDGGQESLTPAGSKPLILYFFAPWCGVCAATSHTVRALHRDPDTEVIAVALSYQTREQVAQYARDQGLDEVPVLLGSTTAARAFRVSSFPTFYVLDEQRNVRSRTVGYTTELGLRLRAL